MPHRLVDIVALGKAATVPAYTEVMPRLWMGVQPDGPLPVDAVLDVFGRHDIDMAPAELRRVHLSDGDEVPDGVDDLALWALERWKDGRTVLVHCAAGLNRSGLVVARALMLDGWPAAVAIAHLRSERHPLVLCNDAFADWLVSL